MKAPYLLKILLDQPEEKRSAASIYLTADAYAADLDRAYHSGRRDGLVDALWITASTVAAIILAFGAIWWIAAGELARWP